MWKLQAFKSKIICNKCWDQIMMNLGIMRNIKLHYSTKHDSHNIWIIVKMKITVIWDVVLHSLESNQYFWGMCFLHLHGIRANWMWMKWYEYIEQVSRFLHYSPYSDWFIKGSYSGPHSPYIHTISPLRSLFLYTKDGGGISCTRLILTAVRTSNLRGTHFEK
jgi:hypothetical protein